MNRRRFLSQSILLWLATWIPWKARAERRQWIPDGRRIPVLQGMTNRDSTQLKILVPMAERLDYRVTGTAGAVHDVTRAEIVTFSNSRYGVEALTVKGLTPGVRYTLEISGENGELLDKRFFRSLDTQASSLRFGVASCLDDRVPTQAEMWAEMIRVKPDLLFLIGDNVYVDNGFDDVTITPRLAWDRYLESRMLLDLYQAEELIPVLAVWDNHDSGMSEGGEESPSLRREMTRIFKAFFGSAEAAGLSHGPGVSGFAEICGQRFALLDGRSFKSRGRNRNQGKTWGDEQLQWLQRKAGTASKAPLWLLNGTQFFGGYSSFDSAENDSPGELTQLKGFVRSSQCPVTFVSGDRHFCELMNLESALVGFPTVEITSSSIHGANDPQDIQIEPNSRRRFETLKHHFVTVESKAQVGKVGFTLRVHGAGAREYHISQHEIIRD